MDADLAGAPPSSPLSTTHAAVALAVLALALLASTLYLGSEARKARTGASAAASALTEEERRRGREEFLARLEAQQANSRRTGAEAAAAAAPVALPRAPPQPTPSQPAPSQQADASLSQRAAAGAAAAARAAKAAAEAHAEKSATQPASAPQSTPQPAQNSQEEPPAPPPQSAPQQAPPPPAPKPKLSTAVPPLPAQLAIRVQFVSARPPLTLASLARETDLSSVKARICEELADLQPARLRLVFGATRSQRAARRPLTPSSLSRTRAEG